MLRLDSVNTFFWTTGQDLVMLSMITQHAYVIFLSLFPVSRIIELKLFVCCISFAFPFAKLRGPQVYDAEDRSVLRS